ncbi:MAG: tRNA (N6-isopentenyl adenosine(37)-C2)-methylthiotransferase MiaB [Deltaproteobacteria bacterium]|nr:tRNA (N6-isopentenyl adenosine(37)-C2)-methylthiotransferase MiaB [Deltaproteobacteria bacterium]
MNEHDSKKIAGLLAPLGYFPVEVLEKADLILFNTCTVREKAHQKAFSEIGKTLSLKNQDPRIIGVCGCVAQEEGAKLLHRFPWIDLVFGPDQIYKLPDLLDLVRKTKKPALATELINRADDYHFLESIQATKLHGPSAFVTIMKGCNSRCSYCIVPKVRGTEVYRPAREIVREVQFLVEKGCREVILLGQNVNSYPGFAKLLRTLAEDTDIERIRYTSPHPKDVKEDLIEEYATNSKLCAHIHLPLQSGSDSVLKRMRRAYNTKTFRSKVERLRCVRPGIGITSDMIVGFAQESDEEFSQTIDFIKEIQFDNIYAFKYSPRPDTEAFALADDVLREIKERRLDLLLTLQSQITYARHQPFVGTTQTVLVEGSDRCEKGFWMGRTSCHKIVNFSGQGNLLGAIVEVKITEANPNSLKGRVIENGQENAGQKNTD